MGAGACHSAQQIPTESAADNLEIGMRRVFVATCFFVVATVLILFWFG